MCSTRQTSRAVPHGCRCEMECNECQACLACEPLELRTLRRFPSSSGSERLKLESRESKKALADTKATWERGMQQALARFWARRSGRGWIWPLLWLSCFTYATATPSVVALRFQTGLSATDTTVDANVTIGGVRLDSEARTLSTLIAVKTCVDFAMKKASQTGFYTNHIQTITKAQLRTQQTKVAF